MAKANHVSFEIGTEKVSRVGFGVRGESLDYFVIYGSTPREILARYTWQHKSSGPGVNDAGAAAFVLPEGWRKFVVGFLKDDGDTWGRPVDAQVAPDGSLLFSDDNGNKIWRVTYAGA